MPLLANEIEAANTRRGAPERPDWSLGPDSD